VKHALTFATACLLLGSILNSTSVRSQNAAAAQDTPAADPQKIKQEAEQLRQEVLKNAAHYNDAPHKKFISASTKEPIYAAYVQGWVARIERMGNLNYPQQARERHLRGNVTVTVGINRDGSVYSIDITRSSGSTVLDDAAKDIVRQSAPFEPIPNDEHERVDILYITRTWQFQPAPSPEKGEKSDSQTSGTSTQAL
jgi:periplasmic protein TonB